MKPKVRNGSIFHSNGVFRSCFLVFLSILFLSNSPAEEIKVPPDTEKEILRKIFELRDERQLHVLKRHETLDRIAYRASFANLHRQNKLAHTDTAGKSLTTRTDEEGFKGHTGEIVSRGWYSFPKSKCDSILLISPSEEGEDFKETICNSPSHYNGFTLELAETGQDWDYFGASILSVYEKNEDGCHKKTSITIVVGK